jgi:hypothetical protein
MSEEHLPKMHADFSLAADEADLDVITEAIGLEPTGVRKKDEWPIQSINAGIACDVWDLSTDLRYSTSVDESLGAIINMLRGKEGAIRHLAEKYDMRVSFTVAIYAEATTMPDLSLKRESLRFLAELGADISFDPYLCRYDTCSEGQACKEGKATTCWPKAHDDGKDA